MQLLVKRILILNLIKKIWCKRGCISRHSHFQTFRVLDLGFFSHKKKEKKLPESGKKLSSTGENWGRKKKLDHFSICSCHPYAGTMLIFSVSFQFYQMSPKRHSSKDELLIRSFILLHSSQCGTN